MLPWLQSLAGWVGIVGVGVWTCLDFIARVLAVIVLYRLWRDGEREEQS